MKLPLLAPISQAISPGRRCRLMTANSARWSRSRAFSARVRNRILSVVNQAWKMDTGQPSACARFGLQPSFAEASEGILLRDLRGCQSCEARGAKQDGGGRRTRTFEVIRRLIYSQLPLPLGTLPRSTASQPIRRNGGDKAMDDVKTKGPDHGLPAGAFMGESPRQSQPTPAANTLREGLKLP